LAQDAPPAPPGAQAADLQHPHFDPAERRAHIAEHLTAVLQLQSSQQGALTAFLDSMKPPGKPPGDRQAHMEHRHDMASLSTPERLDRMLAHFDEMRARMVARVQATKQFYAQLSPSQQKAFDALGPMMGRGGHGGYGMMGHSAGAGPGGPGGPAREMGPDGQPQG
jgi:periplasmic protein CpxP/Spy